MNWIVNSKVSGILVAGDIIAYLFSLILTLGIRYSGIPSRSLLATHSLSFAILIIVFLLVDFSAGLYDKHSAVIGNKAYSMLLRVQLVNAVIGVIFFYFAPVAIAPKANLFIYFIVSTLVLLVWRMIMSPVFSVSRKQSAILIGSGSELEDLYQEVNANPTYGLMFKEAIRAGSDTEENVRLINEAVKRTASSVIVADFHDRSVESAMNFLYAMVFSGVQIIDAGKLYEQVFGRVPLSMLGERWLVENSSTALGNRRVYDTLKRIIDIVVSLVGGILSLIFYPFVYMAIKIEDRGPIFIAQQRVGKNGRMVQIYKFRSMSGNDDGKYGKNGTTAHVVTRVGDFIRKSRIDELPQFWNVFKGDLSLVGPRPEFPHLVGVYEKELQYYNARHLVKPGLFSWAQIYHKTHPHHSVDTEETRTKLAYDLYYIKHRSLTLDIMIILRTAQILLKREGK